MGALMQGRYSLLVPTAAEQFGEREILAFGRVLASRLPPLGKSRWRTVHVLDVAALRGVGLLLSILGERSTRRLAALVGTIVGAVGCRLRCSVEDLPGVSGSRSVSAPVSAFVSVSTVASDESEPEQFAHSPVHVHCSVVSIRPMSSASVAS